MAVTEVFFNFTGAVQTWVVPAGITEIGFEIRGARGQSALSVPGGSGAWMTGVLQVTPGETLSIHVGGQNGYNGGGAATGSGGAGGGGATDIRSGGTALSNRKLVAGGGGGAGRTFAGGYAQYNFGGDGGGTGGGKGGRTTVGGAAGTSEANALMVPATAGSLGQGGKGGNTGATFAGGGGGGGRYGGGGGGSALTTSDGYGGGGGATYWADSPVTRNISTHQSSDNDGSVIITYGGRKFRIGSNQATYPLVGPGVKVHRVDDSKSVALRGEEREGSFQDSFIYADIVYHSPGSVSRLSSGSAGTGFILRDYGTGLGGSMYLMQISADEYLAGWRYYVSATTGELYPQLRRFSTAGDVFTLGPMIQPARSYNTRASHAAAALTATSGLVFNDANHVRRVTWSGLTIGTWPAGTAFNSDPTTHVLAAHRLNSTDVLIFYYTEYGNTGVSVWPAYAQVIRYSGGYTFGAVVSLGDVDWMVPQIHALPDGRFLIVGTYPTDYDSRKAWFLSVSGTTITLNETVTTGHFAGRPGALSVDGSWLLSGWHNSARATPDDMVNVWDIDSANNKIRVDASRHGALGTSLGSVNEITRVFGDTFLIARSNSYHLAELDTPLPVFGWRVGSIGTG